MDKSNQKNPVLKYFIICDEFVREDKSKSSFKQSALGLFDTISSGKFPFVYPVFYIVVGWSGGNGEHFQSINIMDPDGKKLLHTPRNRFLLKGEFQTSNYVVELKNVLFKKIGFYTVQIILDDVVHGEFFFRVEEIEARNVSKNEFDKMIKDPEAIKKARIATA